MSRIVALRDAVMASIREHIPEIEEVDWHDGAFDDEDIEELSMRTPAAFVTVLSVPNDTHLSTRELSADVRVFVNLVTCDDGKRKARESDPELWGLMERLVALANLNKFDCPFAAPATDLKFKRLRDPKLRRGGVAVGCVEWSQGVNIGTNAVVQREYPLGPETTLGEAKLATTVITGRMDHDGHLLGSEVTDCTPDPMETKRRLFEVI